MRSINPTFVADGPTIFTVMSKLAVETGAVNLGQGFPEDGWSEAIIQKAADYLRSESNQYPPMLGRLELRRAVSEHDRHYWGLNHDPEFGVLVTSGATEALAAAIFALIEPGDEVVVFEPFFDSYLPIIRRAGGTVKLVRLEAPDWNLANDTFRQAFNLRTKLILLNNPMNPTGKVWTRTELETIAAVAIEHDCYILSDEVYEHLVFKGQHHIPISSLPGMEPRCLRIGSAGKSFSLTGWKIGWLAGKAELVQAVARAHQFITFTAPPNLQLAVAYGLGLREQWFQGFKAELAAKGDRFIAGLEAIGIRSLPCHGTYFVTIAIDQLRRAEESDLDFCLRLTRDGGVATIPYSALYHQSPPRDYIRLCFAKRDENLAEGLKRLERFCNS
ncbi:MAG: aminotransferase [Alphaproteobacteria bacterium]|nr:aminotransferase [Alphaproteobacteria bacterium]